MPFRNKTNPETSSKPASKAPKNCRKRDTNVKILENKSNANNSWENLPKSIWKNTPHVPENFKTARQRTANTGGHMQASKRKLGDQAKKMNETLLLTRQSKSVKLMLLILSKRPKILEGKRLGIQR